MSDLLAARLQMGASTSEPGAVPFHRLVAAATLAASSHNTQPWKFEIGPDWLRILPDFERRCPQVDPDDHHLYASLGCAAENLVIAAKAEGFDTEVSVTPLAEPATGYAVHIALHRSKPETSPLSAAIPQRQCTRAPFDGRPVAAEELQVLEQQGTGQGVSVLLITDKERMHTVADYVAQGNVAQLRDAAWRDELVGWLRFNQAAAQRTGDGLFSKATGNPELPSMLGRLIIKLALSPTAQNKRDVPWIKSSAGVAVFVSELNDPAHWVEAGRCYERFALQATALGIRNAFINQPVEVAALRSQFARWLELGEQRPDLVVRFGYGPQMPRSYRRPLKQVIISRS